jgi:hypothetical protein
MTVAVFLIACFLWWLGGIVSWEKQNLDVADKYSVLQMRSILIN